MLLARDLAARLGLLHVDAADAVIKFMPRETVTSPHGVGRADILTAVTRSIAASALAAASGFVLDCIETVSDVETLVAAGVELSFVCDISPDHSQRLGSLFPAPEAAIVPIAAPVKPQPLTPAAPLPRVLAKPPTAVPAPGDFDEEASEEPEMSESSVLSDAEEGAEEELEAEAEAEEEAAATKLPALSIVRGIVEAGSDPTLDREAVFSLFQHYYARNCVFCPPKSVLRSSWRTLTSIGEAAQARARAAVRAARAAHADAAVPLANLSLPPRMLQESKPVFGLCCPVLLSGGFNTASSQFSAADGLAAPDISGFPPLARIAEGSYRNGALFRGVVYALSSERAMAVFLRHAPAVLRLLDARGWTMAAPETARVLTAPEAAKFVAEYSSLEGALTATALQGLDPVALMRMSKPSQNPVKGTLKIMARYSGKLLAFASSSSRDIFCSRPWHFSRAQVPDRLPAAVELPLAELRALPTAKYVDTALKTTVEDVMLEIGQLRPVLTSSPKADALMMMALNLMRLHDGLYPLQRREAGYRRVRLLAEARAALLTAAEPALAPITPAQLSAIAGPHAPSIAREDADIVAVEAALAEEINRLCRLALP
jgi:hypothetical protein